MNGRNLRPQRATRVCGRKMLSRISSSLQVATFLLLFLVISSALVSAQEPEGQQQAPQETQKESGLMAAVPTVEPVDPKTYIIGPEDILLIRVWREPELSGPVAVRPDGKFSLPLVGDVQAAGLTPEQVTQRVKEALSKYIRNPEVIVSVQKVNSKKYYISGEIQRPGEYPLVVPTTVVEAIAKAGGFREWANKKKIIIIRGNERLYFNYNDYLEGKNVDQNILLQPGDHIVVP